MRRRQGRHTTFVHPVLQNVYDPLCRELDGLDAVSTQLHPGGSHDRWSMQQVAEHLVLTYRSTSENLQNRLERGRVTRNQRRSRIQQLLQLMILSFGYMPTGAPALEETVPHPGLFPTMDGRELAELLRSELQIMDNIFDRCRQTFGMERVATHPVLGPLRIDQWRRFHAVHAKHHLHQLRRIRRELAQPAISGGPLVGHILQKEMQVPAHRSLT